MKRSTMVWCVVVAGAVGLVLAKVRDSLKTRAETPRAFDAIEEAAQDAQRAYQDEQEARQQAALSPVQERAAAIPAHP